MSKSVKKEILASEYSSEQVLAVNTNSYIIYVVDIRIQKVLSILAPTENVLLRWLRAQFICIKTLWGMSSSTQLEMTFALVWGTINILRYDFPFSFGGITQYGWSLPQISCLVNQKICIFVDQ